MKTSNEGIKLITSFEGCRLKAYKAVPTEKYYTIGYGHYGADVTAGMQITQAMAEELLKQDLIKFEKKVMKYDPVYHYTQNEFDALVSFAYNVGSIDQLTAYGTRNKATIAGAFPLYNKSGGKILAGLVKRRAAEQALFQNKGNTAKVNGPYPVLKKGSRGSYVEILQNRLNQIGKFNLTVDGIFGTNTYNAVIGFQGMAHLIKDGVVGPKTWEALNS